MSKRCLFLTVLLTVAYSRLLSAQNDREQLELAEEQAFKAAAVAAGPSIVRIDTVGGLDIVGQSLASTASTSGLVVDADGYIVSSAFNFISKPSSVLVTVPDGRRFAAKIVATDRLTMVTLLKIEATGLKPPVVSPQSTHRVGQWSIALGRTYETALPSISVGIVSALNRVWGKAIQTDAKVSPVNYGGPLVDIDGKVMGLLVPLSPQASSEAAGVEWYDSGIGFAIPLEDILSVLDRLKKGTDLRPGLAGLALKGKDLYSTNPVIDRVRYDSPASKAGFEPGDRVSRVNGAEIVRTAQIMQVLKSQHEGDKVEITVFREDEEITSTLTLVGELQPYESAFLGILPDRSNTDDSKPGVGVRFLYPESPAEKAGIEATDRIVSFNGEAVSSPFDLIDRVSRVRPGTTAALEFKRGDRQQPVQIELTSIPDEVPESLASALSQPEEKEPDGEDAKTAMTGRFTDKLDGYDQGYWAFVPDSYDAARQWGLLVWLHPVGTTMEATIFNEWKSICEHRGILLLAPKAKAGTRWTPNEAEYVKELIDDFSGKYSIDSRRIVVHGFDHGAVFATQVAFRYRELVTGIAMAGTPLRTAPPENLPEFRQQFYLTCGAKDRLLPLIKRTAAGLRNLKFPVSFRADPDQPHRYPTTEGVEEIGRWIDSLDRI